MVYLLARDLPGLGGPSSLDDLEPHQVVRMLRRLQADKEREARALRSGRK